MATTQVKRDAHEIMKIKVFFDDRYIPLFKNMLYSAVLYKKPGTNIQLDIGIWRSSEENAIRGVLSREGQIEVASFCQKIGIDHEFTDLAPVADKYDFIRLELLAGISHIPPASILARLFFVLEATEDFLYLDVDLILQLGWDELLETSPQSSDTCLMAAPDRAEELWKQRNDPNHSQYWILNGADHRRYFNAGVFRFVYKGWVSKNRSALLIDCLKKIQNRELSVNHGDQDILNYVANGYLEILETTFNSQIFADLKFKYQPNKYSYPDQKYSPKILHFITFEKPAFFDLEKKRMYLQISDNNSRGGYAERTENFFYMYFFIENQRILWELNCE